MDIAWESRQSKEAKATYARPVTRSFQGGHRSLDVAVFGGAALRVSVTELSPQCPDIMFRLAEKIWEHGQWLTSTM
ncbi:unnamed protein product [Cyprideis torosa]|uniref:Uncharacterized protein n=1 Tax=Cyprideis torosa TaxID=163714 RepID=A0A7R8ZKF4_9CRUS|nr:unnamed protein product [Cyprideis torosa]CAG0890788.1 unnamed protein product [Cyprideis torosa]